MIWLNFKGWDGKFAFDLHSRNTLSFKRLFHPSLATYYANSLCYGILNNQKKGLSGRVECKEYFHRIGIKSQAEYYDWCRHNHQTRIKLCIPYNPHVTYKNHGWTTWYKFFGKQPPVTADTQLPYIDCAKLVQE